MTQWRDTGTETNTNNNMWPYTVRLLQQKAVEKGCEYIYGAQGLTLVHENGKVTGAIFTDIDGKYFQVNADAVIVQPATSAATRTCVWTCATPAQPGMVLRQGPHRREQHFFHGP